METEEAENLNDSNLVKTIVLDFPKPPLVYARRSRIRKIGRLLQGQLVRVGEYFLELHRNERYTAIKLTPRETKSRTFYYYNGTPTKVLERKNTPRIKTPFTLFLWELVLGVHHNNLKLSKEVKVFLDKLKELLVE